MHVRREPVYVARISVSSRSSLRHKHPLDCLKQSSAASSTRLKSNEHTFYLRSIAHVTPARGCSIQGHWLAPFGATRAPSTTRDGANSAVDPATIAVAGSYTTSLKGSLLWMGSTLRELAWPPIPLDEISKDETKAVSVTKKVEQQNSQVAQVDGSGFIGCGEIRNPKSTSELTGQVIFRRTWSRLVLWIALSPQLTMGSPGVVTGDLEEAWDWDWPESVRAERLWV